MRATDCLIDQIVASSQIPFAHRRREVVRELRAHIDDFALAARDTGLDDAQIERMILANFGDPAQMGRNFAWVYRRERALLRLTVFAISTVAIASLAIAGTLAAQAGVAAGFGVPMQQTLASRHTVIEAADILSTVAFYTGFLAIEHLFVRRRFLNSIVVLSVTTVALVAVCSPLGVRAPYLIFGFVNGTFLRMVQVALKRPPLRYGAVVLSFVAFGLLLWHATPASLASWMIMGGAYQSMTALAGQVDTRLRHALEEL